MFVATQQTTPYPLLGVHGNKKIEVREGILFLDERTLIHITECL